MTEERRQKLMTEQKAVQRKTEQTKVNRGKRKQQEEK